MHQTRGRCGQSIILTLRVSVLRRGAQAWSAYRCAAGFLSGLSRLWVISGGDGREDRATRLPCLLCANRVLMHRSKQQPYSITSGWWQAAFIGSSDRIDFACFEVDDETRTWWPVERSPGLPILRAFQRRRKKRTKASKNATIRKPAISFVVRPPIWWCSMDEGATFGDPHKLLPSSGTYCGVTPRRMARRSVRAVRRA